MQGTKEHNIKICSPGWNSRILNSDHSSRISRVLSFQRPSNGLGVRSLSVLSELNVGESGVLVSLDLQESVQNHLMHMGFVPDALVTVLRRAPAGDPTVYGVDGIEIALRHETAAAIRMKPAEAARHAIEASPVGASQDAPELLEAAR